MHLLLRHWSLDPFLAIAAVVIVLHTVGLRRRLRALRRTGQPLRTVRGRAAAFYGGIALFAVAIDSPVDFYANRYLTMHMLQHILLAFFAPPLVVIGAPWLALQRGLPRAGRQVLGRTIQQARRRPGWRRAGQILSHPVTAIVSFNVTMVFWHLPGPFDLSELNPAVHIWLDHGSIVATALLLWLAILDSPPYHPRWSPIGRAGVAFISNAVMVMIAMTLVLFSHDLYPVYAHQLHTVMSQYSDQQVAGSVLWICGEFTLAPAIYWNVQLFLKSQARSRSETAASPWARRSAARWQPAIPDRG